MIVYRLTSTMKDQLRRTRCLYIQGLTNARQRQYQSALHYSLVTLETKVTLLSINLTRNYAV